MNEYICKECGCEEFVSNPSQYDIYEHENGKLIFRKSEFMDDELELFCRECSQKLVFNSKDVVF